MTIEVVRELTYESMDLLRKANYSVFVKNTFAKYKAIEMLICVKSRIFYIPNNQPIKITP